jgi:hypothetical protein
LDVRVSVYEPGECANRLDTASTARMSAVITFRFYGKRLLHANELLDFGKISANVADFSRRTRLYSCKIDISHFTLIMIVSHIPGIGIRESGRSHSVRHRDNILYQRQRARNKCRCAGYAGLQCYIVSHCRYFGSQGSSGGHVYAISFPCIISVFTAHLPRCS